MSIEAHTGSFRVAVRGRLGKPIMSLVHVVERKLGLCTHRIRHTSVCGSVTFKLTDTNDAQRNLYRWSALLGVKIVCHRLSHQLPAHSRNFLVQSQALKHSVHLFYMNL